MLWELERLTLDQRCADYYAVAYACCIVNMLTERRKTIVGNRWLAMLQHTTRSLRPVRPVKVKVRQAALISFSPTVVTTQSHPAAHAYTRIRWPEEKAAHAD